MSDLPPTDPAPTDPAPTDLARLARSAWSALEVLHVVGYFSTEPRERYKALGLRPSLAYFAARSAPMGPVPAEVTVATFYVFSPVLVAAALPAAWAVAAPKKVLQARHDGVTATLHRLLDAVVDSAELAEAGELALAACAGLSAPGRPLYAAHSALPLPADPMLRLWHAATLLREHRGDGHVAALLHAGLDPVEALVTGGLASGTTPFMRATRGWSEEQWASGEQRLVDRGLLALTPTPGEQAVRVEPTLTDAGLESYAAVEAQTGRAALAGWAHLGVQGTARLVELVRPWRDVVLAAGVIPAELGRRA